MLQFLGGILGEICNILFCFGNITISFFESNLPALNGIKKLNLKFIFLK
jgi:hypothetical protein